MKEELENTANEALRAIIDNAAAAKDFILAELPEVVQQLLMWKMIESILSMVVSILCCLIAVGVNVWQFKVVKKHWERITSESAEPFLMFNVLQLFWILPICLLFSMTWLKILIAPKVYLLEYATHLVR